MRKHRTERSELNQSCLGTMLNEGTDLARIVLLCKGGVPHFLQQRQTLRNISRSVNSVEEVETVREVIDTLPKQFGLVLEEIQRQTVLCKL